jgi:uncharacterized membrane protein YdjX (TVP38/TMEM64 family)
MSHPSSGPSSGPPSHPSARSTVLIGVLAVLAVAALVVVALTVDLPDVSVLRTWIMSVGPLAPLAFVAGYAVIVPTPIPKGVLTAAGGVAFGIAAGIPLVLLGATTGAALSFGISRLLGRDAVDHLAHGRLERVDALIERHGVTAALVVRLVPVLPFTVLNYACGVTAMRLRHYLVGTASGLAPSISVVVVLASSGARISLWVPVLISVTLASVSLGGGALWHSRHSR